MLGAPRDSKSSRSELKPWQFGAAIGASGLVVAGVFTALAVIANHSADVPTAQLWVDIVTRSLAVLAGAGGVIALWLAFRRQRTTEQQQRHHEDTVRAEQADRDRQQRHHEDTVHQDQVQRALDAKNTLDDAIQRRITELRIQAVAQLGSDKAAIRIGGLHNLERLAEQHPELRQVVINELCGYLRMPYERPTDTSFALASHRWRADDAVDYSADPRPGPDTREERQVRLTAQRILERHLKDDGDLYWDHASLDLTGAQLESVDFRGCRLGQTKFENAVLWGDSSFAHVTFDGPAHFKGTRFKGFVTFSNLTGRFGPCLEDAVFDDGAVFGGHCTVSVLILGCTFNQRTSFFHGHHTGLNVSRTTFGKDIYIGGSYDSDIVFRNVVAEGNARFTSLSLVGALKITDTRFLGSTTFTEVDVESLEVKKTTIANHAQFSPVVASTATFAATTFNRQPQLEICASTGLVMDKCKMPLRGQPRHLPAAWSREPDTARPGHWIISNTDSPSPQPHTDLGEGAPA